jgi:hypothetical protein
MTPLICPNRASGPQNHPMPNVATSDPAGTDASIGKDEALRARLPSGAVILSFSFTVFVQLFSVLERPQATRRRRPKRIINLEFCSTVYKPIPTRIAIAKSISTISYYSRLGVGAYSVRLFQNIRIRIRLISVILLAPIKVLMGVPL